jgi:ribosome-associated protein
LRKKQRKRYCRDCGETEIYHHSYSTIASRRAFLAQKKISTIPEIETEETPDRPGWLLAVGAAQSKQAKDITVLDLTGVTTFTDYFVICSGSNSRQNQAITDAIHFELKKIGDLPNSIEGYNQGEWVLSDYGDFIVHVFSEKSREYYSLERLWREGKTVEIPAE